MFFEKWFLPCDFFWSKFGKNWPLQRNEELWRQDGWPNFPWAWSRAFASHPNSCARKSWACDRWSVCRMSMRPRPVWGSVGPVQLVVHEDRLTAKEEREKKNSKQRTEYNQNEIYSISLSRRCRPLTMKSDLRNKKVICWTMQVIFHTKFQLPYPIILNPNSLISSTANEKKNGKCKLCVVRRKKETKKN